MESLPQHCYHVYIRSINDYHKRDNVDEPLNNPYAENSPDSLFYRKNWIDTVQWHLEDIIRDPDIDSVFGLSIKRRIDDLNQKRTDIVEHIDEYFHNMYKDIVPERNARFNTESLGWAFDRLSILALKEFHLNEELCRKDTSVLHMNNCLSRKKVLAAQKEDLLESIGWLIDDIQSGRKINKTYKQLKMYNDPSFNPVLYKRKELT